MSPLQSLVAYLGVVLLAPVALAVWLITDLALTARRHPMGAMVVALCVLYVADGGLA